MIAVAMVYAGLGGLLLALVSLVHPLSFPGIRTRPQALVVLAAAIAVVLIGACLPARAVRVAVPRTQLDLFLPEYQFDEFHSLQIPASKEQVYRALKAVTADDIALFRTLVWIRRFGRPGPESILNPPANTPLLDVATRTSFLLLAESTNQEIVIGTLGAAPRGWRPNGTPTAQGFQALASYNRPGFAFAAMNFRLQDCDPLYASTTCTLLTTETRVYAPDASTRRLFAGYWRLIYPGSSLIRRMWLRAVAKRAVAN